MSIYYQKINCKKIILVTTIFGGLNVLMPRIRAQVQNHKKKGKQNTPKLLQVHVRMKAVKGEWGKL